MFKTYNASAGSGKTTNLVAEYLAICLRDTRQYRHLLAITFTNNATAEMKERILLTLNDFAFTNANIWEQWDSQPNNLKKQLGRSYFIHQTTRQLSGLDSPTIQKNAVELLEKILSDYPNFAVSTIDSFFQKIIRSFAFDLGLNLDFSVEITLDDYFQQTVDLLYQRISNDNDYTKDLGNRVLRLVFDKLTEKGTWRMDDDLLQLLATVYYDERAGEQLEKLQYVDFVEAEKLLKTSLTEAQKKYQLLITEVFNIIHNAGIADSDFPRYGILEWLNSASLFEIKSYKALNKSIEEGASFTKKGCSDFTPSERDAIIAKKQEIEQQYFHVAQFQIVNRNIRKFHLLFDLKNIMEELREQDNKFFLSKTGDIIRKEVQTNPVPYIYSKVGTRFHNYFIDEFQDTSDTQWDNLLPLLDEAVAGNETDGKVILFGDVKQAIYRFRNGNPQLFADLTQLQSTRRNHFERRTLCTETQLDTNHRTLQKIVTFNNRFFQQLPTFDSFPPRLRQYQIPFYTDFYQKVAQKTSKKDDGFVAIRFWEGASSEINKIAYAVQSSIDAVADARARGYRLHDIAVLCRTAILANDIATALSINHIPVISTDSLVLDASDEVNLIIALLRHLERPNDPLAKFTLVHYLLKRNNKEAEIAKFTAQIVGEKVKILPTPTKTTEEFFAQQREEERRTIHNNHVIFNNLLEKEFNIQIPEMAWRQLSLLTLVHQILSILHLHKTNSYLVGFVDLVNDYMKDKGNELSEFLKWWDKKGHKKAITSPDNIDAVRIMTIHKSKGKEFPVVIMPLLNKQMRLTISDTWQPLDPAQFGIPSIILSKNKENSSVFQNDNFAEECALTALDEANITYVGQTRAEEALYLIAQERRDETKKSVGRSDFFNYSLLLEDFIKANETDFEEVNDWFWYGNRAHTNTKMAKKEPEAAAIITEIPISDFSTEQLVPLRLASEQLEIGRAVHAFFENALHFPQSEAEVEAWQFDANELYPNEIRAALHTLVQQENILPYFADGLDVLREITILTEDGERKRPDRVVKFPNETVVIDFKTGAPSEAQQRKYETQVNEYVKLLDSMGFPNVRGEIVYLH